MPKEFIIYCDESLESGEHYSNFYGGALVGSNDIDRIKQSLQSKKTELNLFNEVKWSKISKAYEKKYCELVEHFFEFIKAGEVKIRIMFTHNRYVPVGLSPEQRENQYFLLYYQFLKHAFGLRHCGDVDQLKYLRIYLDKLPDTKEKVKIFRSFILGLNRNPQLRRTNFLIREDSVTDVVSHDHVILQCLDIILGSMQFRLNDLHKKKPKGSRIRGSRTRAKERVYMSINKHIRAIRPNFNIGITTGVDGDIRNRWHHPYRHWVFTPNEAKIDPAIGKKRK